MVQIVTPVVKVHVSADVMDLALGIVALHVKVSAIITALVIALMTVLQDVTRDVKETAMVLVAILVQLAVKMVISQVLEMANVVTRVQLILVWDVVSNAKGVELV